MDRNYNDNCRRGNFCSDACYEAVSSDAVRLAKLIRHNMPQAIAEIKGGNGYGKISGKILFYQQKDGVFVVADVKNLPADGCKNIFAMHIHSGEDCTGNSENRFADAQGHYNPEGKEHPCHRGDLPPLFASGSGAFYAALLNRFTVKEVIGRTVIIHKNPDDFTTQPSGNSGEMIACGEIKSNCKNL